jgi:hypothetical protein
LFDVADPIQGPKDHSVYNQRRRKGTYYRMRLQAEDNHENFRIDEQKSRAEK